MFEIIVLIVIFLFTVTFHEVAHGYAAYFCGDNTAKEQNRLTLNPIRHIDLFWTVLFPALLFFATSGRFALGMAKPVPVNFGNLRHRKRDMIIVAVVGPLMNLMFAWALAAGFHATQFTPFLYGAYFNLGLAFFNLIPVPPLDGSRILAGFLPIRYERVLDQVEFFGFWIILVLYMTGILLRMIVPFVVFSANLLSLPSIGM